MHTYLPDRVIYTSGTTDTLVFLVPDFTSFWASVISIENPSVSYIGYDDWVSYFSRSDELDIVSRCIQQVKKTPWKRLHIRGISTAESVEQIRGYYRECGYEDALAKNYTLPPDIALTVSVSLSHVLWCEKDKTFLDSWGSDGKPYGHIVPPLRSPHDLRSLQQGLRMGVILGIEVSPREAQFLSDILERQVASPFLLSQMIHFRWKKYWFTGIEHAINLEYPDFSERNMDN